LREIARRFAPHRRLRLAGAGVLATLTTIAALGAPSALAAGSVTIKTSFEQSPISLNTSDAIGFAIGNTTGSALTNLTFTDTLPAGVTLDNPTGLTNTPGSTTSCGSATSVNPTSGAGSAPGDTAVTITIASVPTLASGTVCTISLGVVASQPSVADAPYKDSLSSTFTTPKPVLTPGSLIVLGNPAITLVRPTNNLVLKFGQLYDGGFSCVTTDPLDSINSVIADDDNGNSTATGEPIDTVDAGPNALEVDCYSGVGGGDVTQTVNYTVRPFTLTSVKAIPASGGISFKSVLPAGTGVAELLDGKKLVGKEAFKVNSRKNVKVVVKPTASGERLVTAAATHGLKVKLEVTFAPRAIGTGNDVISPQGPTIVTRSLKLKPAR
jgi:hypothetical protein